jgi:hypothetical protein
MNIINANSINSQLKTTNMFYIKNIIKTPYEKVLSIIQETLKTLNLANKAQSKLFTELQWVIKIIKSHLLYSYEIKEKTYVAELSKNDPDFKQFVDFVTEYNEQVIEMNRKNNFINNELLQKPSFKLKRQYITNNQKIFNLSNKRSNSNDINKNQKEKITINCLKKVMKQSYLNKTPNHNNELIININDNRIFNNQLVNHNLNNSNNSNLIASGIYKNSNYMNRNKINNGLFNNYNSFSIKNAQNNSRNKQITSLNMLKQFNSNLSNEKNNSTINYLNKINKFLNKNTNFQKVNNSNKHITSLNPKKLLNENNQKTSEMDSLEKYSYIYIDHLLKQYNYDTKHITEKDFNIFELKKIVGQSNVLPLMGRVILETFGLKDDKIINVSKLETFLNTVSSQYLTTTLYHNNMHGADVTQTISLFFLNSNAEKMFQTTVLDLLSIFIAALGHDLGHPGLTNNFHVNASTELAITYNDASCLENFHCCKLFTILKKDETNIFEKLTVNDYKDIRKRMISEILATDMFYHKKVMTMIQSQLPQIKNDKFEFTDDKDTMKKEQQSLLDFFIHSADLAHNTKLFNISLKWVELLSEEFWLQGDKEKSMGLTVSFLCDRKDTNVPSSQVNFIRGFILPTFDVLIKIFPTLSYTVENANNNINEWQKLVDAHRLKGWTPRNINNEENKNEKNVKTNENTNKKNYNENHKLNKEKDNIFRTNVNRWKPEKINIK